MNTCPACGYDNTLGTLFCEECGHGLAPEVYGQRYATGEIAEPVARAALDSVARLATRTTGDVSARGTAEVRERFTLTDTQPDLAGRTGSGPLTEGRPEPSPGRALERPTRLSGDLRPMAPTAGETDTPPTQPAPGSLRVVHNPAGPSHGASGMAVYLVSESGRRVDVPDQDVVIVGREDMRSGIRPDVDLTLDGASAAGVSRRHCRLLRQADGWYLEDLMSTNFTVVNGKALAAHTPARVHDGDDLRLGKLRLKFHEA